MRAFYLLLICLFATVAGFAQPNPGTVWQRTFDTGEQEFPWTIEATLDSGFVVAGEIDYSDGSYEGYVIRMTGSGDTLWTRRFPGERLGLSDVRQTPDSGFVLAGTAMTVNEGLNAVLIRLTPSGDTLWTRMFGGSQNDAAAAVRVLPDGFVMAGTSSSFGEEGSDLWVVRTDFEGDTLWTRTYGAPDEQTATAMVEASDGGYVVCGYTGPPVSNAVDALLVKFDEQGFVLWSRVYGDGADSTDYPSAVVQTPEDGGYLVCCLTNARGMGFFDTWLIKTNRSGDSLWTRTIGTVNDEQLLDMERVPGGYALFGVWINTRHSDANMLLTRVDALGNLHWNQYYGGFNIEIGTSLCRTADGGYGLTGYRTNVNEENWNIQVIRTGPDLTLPVREFPTAMPGDVSLAAYPNPFNPTAMLSFTLERATLVSLRIHDLTGREVAGLCSDQMLTAGEHRFLFDGAQLSSGVYFARLDGPDFAVTAKLLLVR